MTFQDVADDINERGTFWWMIHELNALPIPDWAFLIMLILTALILFSGILKVLDPPNEPRDLNPEAREEER